MGQELRDVGGLLSRQSRKHVFQVGVRIMPSELRRLDQTHDCGCALASAQ